MGAVTDTIAKVYNDCFNQVKNYEYREIILGMVKWSKYTCYIKINFYIMVYKKKRDIF